MIASAPMFYCENLAEIDSDGTLSAQESRHVSAARRLRPGDCIALFDGAGTVATATVGAAHSRKLVTFSIVERSSLPAPTVRLTVACAVPRGDRQNTLLDMLTQLGVTDIQPVIFEHSAWRQSQAPERWRRILLEASKQCRRAWLPLLHSPITIDQLYAQLSDCPQVLVADQSGQALTSLQVLGDDVDCMIIVGPEGGYSANEREQLSASATAVISVGHNVLRVEAAAVAATAVVAAVRGSGVDSH